jgi:protein-S-isoprenylcysteine O-methyltransferase Ste14
MTSDRAVGWLLVTAQFVLLAVIVLGPTGGAWQLPSWAALLARAAEVSGLAVILLGALQLGRAASVHPAPTATARLRTGGLYRLARHPIYTGVLLFATGETLRSRSVVSLIAAVALVAVLNIKTRIEERMLAARFPDYPAYARTTGRFAPRLRHHS